ncbi:alpha/beta fold hydrolase [Solimonas flava]|uniref:alpha/beta fold hydrolase n=1 Tax=Solimonas flava TaxID=415849 RepID=UPI000420B496|nr:alpha/beta hydrolase [Solimonas flava]
MPSATINGAEIAWQQMGEGPDLVLVHGLATNRAFWYGGVASGLRDRFRVTLFDLPGHGYSAMPPQGYSATALGHGIVELMDQAGIERAALVGHSFGGACALEAAVAAPRRFSHLGLLDTRVNRLQPEMRLHDVTELSAFEREVAARSSAAFGYDWESETQVGLRFLEAAARLRAAGTVNDARDEFTPFGEGRGALRAAQQWLRLLDGTAAPAEFNQPGASREAIAALPMPVLLMYAQHSRCEISGRQLAQLLPQARYLSVANAGHFFPVSQARRVIDELMAFLEPQRAVA